MIRPIDPEDHDWTPPYPGIPRPDPSKGFPAGSMALYGPDDQTPTKIVAVVLLDASGSPGPRATWEGPDVTNDPNVARESRLFFDTHGVLQVVLSRGVMGCPHEEGVEYPAGTPCPQCPFWANEAVDLDSPDGMAQVMLGVAYFLKEEWDAWKEDAEDSAGWASSWEEWRDQSREKIAHLRGEGYDVRWLRVFLDEFTAWRGRTGFGNTADARARYVSEMLASREGGGPVTGASSSPDGAESD